MYEIVDIFETHLHVTNFTCIKIALKINITRINSFSREKVTRIYPNEIIIEISRLYVLSAERIDSEVRPVK